MKYRLNGITKYGFSILKPERLPSILLLILSILLMVSGFLNTFPNPDGLYQSFNDDGYYGANLIAIWGGGFLAVVAILLLVIMRERYSVRISTAEGEKCSS
jgi:nitrate reductase gamma subunit